jgi:L,D-transpeptidase ErfK/SrfK
MRRRLIVASLVWAGLFLHPVAGPAGEPDVITGVITTHIVGRGETLRSLASQFGVDPSTIASDNNLAASRTLEPGRTIRIDNRHIVPSTLVSGEIVVNVPQRMLFFRSGDRVLAYPVAVGRATWQTPQGPFSVVRKEEDPAWHVPESIRAESARKGRKLPAVVPPGPRNPLGRFWIGLSLASIGLHGTPFPSSIYQTATHGCVRLQGDRIEDLFGRVAVGTPGRIIYEPVLIAANGDGVYLEVHPDAYRQLRMNVLEQAREMATRLALADRIDWTLAAREIEHRAGVARLISFTTPH